MNRPRQLAPLLLLVLLPLVHTSPAPQVKKAAVPTLASIGIRSLSVEH